MGQKKAGKNEGHGVLYLENGDQFEGEFVDGMRARGTYRHTNGDLYTGPYKNDKPNGSMDYRIPVVVRMHVECARCGHYRGRDLRI